MSFVRVYNGTFEKLKKTADLYGIKMSAFLSAILELELKDDSLEKNLPLILEKIKEIHKRQQH